MTSVEQKRMRLDTSCSSKTGPDFTLRIIPLEDRHEGMILKLDTEEFAFEPASVLEISDIVDQVYFQDNTLAFKTILLLKKLALIIYPPGSGKTTMALLLESYLSSRIEWSDELTTFFENCEFAKACPVEYEKFKKSSNVAYISFEEIRGSTRAEFEESLIAIMLKCFENNFSDDIFQEEKTIMARASGNVYNSLMRFSTELHRRDKTKTTYLLLDSCDTAYNTIITFDVEAAEVCKEFTKFIRSAAPTGSSSIVVLCFGVSPYFAHEFSSKAHIHAINRPKNELGKYFSYSTETIEKVIREWKLNTRTSLDECMKVAQFKFDKSMFINPGICVSFLKSLHLKEECFNISIVPRSLWLSSIFTIEDRELLLNVLSSSCEQEFNMGVSIMTIISNFQEPKRKLFYPLFIFGGFISCKPGRSRNKFVLDVANEVSRCVLEKSLDDIYVTVYKRGFKKCSEIYKMIFNNKWQDFCNAMSEMLSNMSTKTFNKEIDYNNWLFGLLCPAVLNKFSVKKLTVTNNISLAGIFPDIRIWASGIPKIASLIELKLLKALLLRKKMKANLTLSERYGESDLTDAHKRTIISSVRRELTDVKLQTTQYASSHVSVEKCESLKCIILIFYLNHVVLVVNDFHFENNVCRPTKWTAYCSGGFLQQEDLEEIMK